jgi:hypothetical protein
MLDSKYPSRDSFVPEHTEALLSRGRSAEYVFDADAFESIDQNSDCLRHHDVACESNKATSDFVQKMIHATGTTLDAEPSLSCQQEREADR